jgi:hypothetical protein
MAIEDIAIIRETLAELDDEELTALDLENHNFKQTPVRQTPMLSDSQANFSDYNKDGQTGSPPLMRYKDTEIERINEELTYQSNKT